MAAEIQKTLPPVNVSSLVRVGSAMSHRGRFVSASSASETSSSAEAHAWRLFISSSRKGSRSSRRPRAMTQSTPRSYVARRPHCCRLILQLGCRRMRFLNEVRDSKRLTESYAIGLMSCRQGKSTCASSSIISRPKREDRVTTARSLLIKHPSTSRLEFLL